MEPTINRVLSQSFNHEIVVKALRSFPQFGNVAKSYFHTISLTGYICTPRVHRILHCFPDMVNTKPYLQPVVQLYHLKLHSNFNPDKQDLLTLKFPKGNGSYLKPNHAE